MRGLFFWISSEIQSAESVRGKSGVACYLAVSACGLVDRVAQDPDPSSRNNLCALR